PVELLPGRTVILAAMDVPGDDAYLRRVGLRRRRRAAGTEPFPENQAKPESQHANQALSGKVEQARSNGQPCRCGPRRAPAEGNQNDQRQANAGKSPPLVAQGRQADDAGDAECVQQGHADETKPSATLRTGRDGYVWRFKSERSGKHAEIRSDS